MILFAANNHYGTHAGQNLFECLHPHHEIRFHEYGWPCLIEENLIEKEDVRHPSNIANCRSIIEYLITPT